jgi:hypothetical protein
VRDRIKRAVGARASVSVARGGTIVVLMEGGRDEAERTAAELVSQLESVTCGIIAFPAEGLPLAQSIPAPMLEPEPRAAVAT